MVSKTQFTRLFEPGQIGSMTLKNRIFMPGMGTNFCDENGYVTRRVKDYYAERAKGGVGLIIVEATEVESLYGRRRKTALCVDDDKFIPGLSELAGVIKRHGTRVAIQLNHAGSDAKSRVIGRQPVAPSPIAQPGGEVPRELTRQEISEIIDYFARAAQRVQKAGFDGVEIHGAHRYLVAEFLSSDSNKRNDDYGGNLRNRARFLIEIIMATRALVGQDFPVWCRINGEEPGVPCGITIPELHALSQMVRKAGVDAINVSASPPARSMYAPRGYYVHLAEAVKQVVDIPVMVAGGINLEVGEKTLEDSKADFIGIGRGLIVDPELPNKALSSKLDDIAPCIRCLDCIHTMSIKGEAMQCAVNAAAGNERGSRIRRTRQKKTVLVVGGGPGGMEAARVAALRGHDVTLYEKGHALGGQLLLAGRPPHKEELLELADYLARQITRLGVKIELGKEADPGLISRLKPDVVVFATGSLPLIPKIPGIGRDNVVTALDVLSGKTQVGDRVIIIGGALVGCETAALLAERGKKVTIIEKEPKMASAVTPRVRGPLLDMLTARGVDMRTSVECEEIVDTGLVICDAQGSRGLIRADSTVIAAGALPNKGLFDAMQGKVAEVYAVGDCVEPRRIRYAIHEGASIGGKI